MRDDAPVTRLDERGAPIDVGPSEREALGLRLGEEKDVVAAYLFGSQATGAAGPLSDVDVAVWLDGTATRSERFTRQLDLIGALGSVLRTDEVQVVILDDATPLLAHRVLRDGVLLLDRDPHARVRLETAAMLAYLDTIPLRQELSRGLASRMASGTYGRSHHG